MKEKEIKVLPGAAEMADFLASLLVKGSEEKPAGEYLYIALSGGTTPKQIFENLTRHHKDRVQWDTIRFFQVDERCVPPDDKESNFKMIRSALFEPLKIPAGNIFRMKGENDPRDEAERHGTVIAGLLPQKGGYPVFDIILLGLGSDGHTASLFPGNFFTLSGYKWCETAVHPLTGQQRITLTLPVINHARRVIFMLTGTEKAAIVAEILQNPEPPVYPALLVRPVNGSLTWLLDSEAARLVCS